LFCAIVNGRNHYDVLGLGRRSTATEIKKQYRKLAKKYHPDKNQGDSNAQERFVELSTAYETLSDDGKRREYDHELQFGNPHHQYNHHHHHPQQRRQQHFQFGNEDQGEEEVFLFQSADGRIFTTTRNRRQFQQQHFSQESHNNPFFDFETYGESSQFDSGWWGYVHFFFLMILFGLNIIIMLLFGLHAISPMALLLLLIGLVMCCVPSRCFNGRADNGRRRRSNPTPAPPPDEEKDLAEVAEDDFSIKGTIVVVATTDKGRTSLLILKNRYRRDPVQFFMLGKGATIEVAEWDEACDIIATSKGGKQWAGIQIPGTDGSKTNTVDMWLLRLIGGEVQWTSSDSFPILMNR
jgi:hypothetical protein